MKVNLRLTSFHDWRNADERARALAIEIERQERPIIAEYQRRVRANEQRRREQRRLMAMRAFLNATPA